MKPRLKQYVMAVRLAAVGLILAIPGTPSTVRSVQPDEPDYGAQLRERRGIILTALAGQTWSPGDDPRRAIYLGVVKIGSGIEAAEGLRYLAEATDRAEPWDCFHVYAIMDAVLRLRDRLPADLVERMKNKLAASFGTDLGFTENHKLQYRTARYLFGQTWPDSPSFKDGSSPQQARREAETWIDDWISRTVSVGQYEFDSPNYASLYYLCLTSLYDFSRDPLMRRKAWMMMHLLLADAASEYLKGNWIGAHSREKFNQVTHTTLHSGTATPFGFLFFGQSAFHPEIPEQFYVGLAALQGFTPLPLVGRMASERGRPYVHLETKAPRRGLGVNTNDLPIWKYSYVTSDYALGSSTGDISDVENHRWDLTWVSGRDGSTLFFINPFFSKSHLLSYFADDPDKIVGNILKQRPYADDPDKWIEGSPYEELFQQENTLIALYDIPAAETFRHVNGFFSKTIDRREQDPAGWIFGRADGVYFAVRPLTPGVWHEEKDHDRLTLSDRRTGVVLEAAQKSEYPSFAAFKDKIKGNALRIDLDRLRVAYTNSRGDRQDFQYPDRRLLNDKPVLFDQWPLFSGPFMEAEKGTKIVVIRAGGESVILDFNDFSIRFRGTTADTGIRFPAR